MNLFGFEISRASQKQLAPAHSRNLWRTISEPFAGAWQRNIEEKRGELLIYPTLYACLSRISSDIGTIPFRLVRRTDDIWAPVSSSAYSSVLRKPNNYQTDQQFREAWALSVLQHGNAYVLKARDARQIVVDLYVLDPRKVTPKIAPNGDVWYSITYDKPENLLPEQYSDKEITVPAREIIHHRINCLHHQLVGIAPIIAASWPTVKNLRILKNSAEFFGNNAQPGGILTAPAGMSQEDFDEVKKFWDGNYSGENRGKIAVIGADMKFTGFTMSGVDAQLVEQMQYSDRQICQPFGVPPFIVGVGEIPAGMRAEDMANTYYRFALRPLIESMERLLEEGIGVSDPLGIEGDESALLRMDVERRAAFVNTLVGGKIMLPNEARAQFNMPATSGGDTLWGQHQDYPLGVLAERDDLAHEPEPVISEHVADDGEEFAKWSGAVLSAMRDRVMNLGA